MSKVTFKMNPNFEKELMEQIQKSPLQEQLNERMREIVRGVDRDMKHGDLEAIHSELVKRISAEGFEPNPENLREVARAIADGELVH